jgi:hypothetical protein
MHVVLEGSFDPKVVAPGEKARLTITAKPTDGWHIYALAARDPQKIAKPTLIALVNKAGWPSIGAGCRGGAHRAGITRAGRRDGPLLRRAR